MSFREDEKRWQRIHEALAAEASGKTPRPFSSQRTLFGIKSTVEEQIQRIVEEDEAARRTARYANETGSETSDVHDSTGKNQTNSNDEASR